VWVIDNNPEVIQKAQDEGFICFRGDATQDKILIQAGIKRAKGVVCVLPSDAENLYVILTAKELINKYILYPVPRKKNRSTGSCGREQIGSCLPTRWAVSEWRWLFCARPCWTSLKSPPVNKVWSYAWKKSLFAKGSPFITQSLEDSGIRKRYGLNHCCREKGFRKDDFQSHGQLYYCRRRQVNRDGRG